jgi:Bacterial Ig-like domain (group 1)
VAYDTSYNGGNSDAFVTKLDMIGAPYSMTLTPATDTNTVGTPHTVTATVQDFGGRPVSGVTVRFSVTGSNTTSGTGTSPTNASGQATFTYTGTVAGPDAIHAYADTNNNSTQNTGEPFADATKIWTAGTPTTLVLTPPAMTNVVGAQHCVTATVRDTFGNPTPGITVRFSVTSTTFPSPSSGSATTNASGQATFCYTASLPGQDAIHAYADTNNNTMQDLTEPFGNATKTWTPPPSTSFCEVTITNGGWIITNAGDRANFGGNAKVSADGSSVQGEEQYHDSGPAQPLNVHSISLTATTCSSDLKSATIFGTATVNGNGTHVFRIDVTDMGSPGTNDTYGIMLDTGYTSGQKKLQGGNVTIHKTS